MFYLFSLGIVSHVFADIEAKKKKNMSLIDMQYFITTLPALGNFLLSAVMLQAPKGIML